MVAGKMFCFLISSNFLLTEGLFLQARAACAEWCETHSDTWSVKCGWGIASCSRCSSCNTTTNNITQSFPTPPNEPANATSEILVREKSSLNVDLEQQQFLDALAMAPEHVLPYRNELKEAFTSDRNLEGFFKAIGESPELRKKFTMMKAAFPELEGLSHEAHLRTISKANRDTTSKLALSADEVSKATSSNDLRNLLATHQGITSNEGYDPVADAKKQMAEIEKEMKKNQEEMLKAIEPFKAAARQEDAKAEEKRKKLGKKCEKWREYQKCTDKVGGDDAAIDVAKMILGEVSSGLTGMLTGGLLPIDFADEIPSDSFEECWEEHGDGIYSSKKHLMWKFSCTGDPATFCKGKIPSCPGWGPGIQDDKCESKWNPEVVELTCQLEKWEAAIQEVNNAKAVYTTYERLLEADLSERKTVYETLNEDIHELERKVEYQLQLYKKTFAYHLEKYADALPTQEQVEQLELNRKVKRALQTCKGIESCDVCRTYYKGERRQNLENAVKNLEAGKLNITRASLTIKEIEQAEADALHCRKIVPDKEWWFQHEYGGSCDDERWARDSIQWWEFWRWFEWIEKADRAGKCEGAEWEVWDAHECVKRNEHAAATKPALIPEYTLWGRKAIDQWQPIVESLQQERDIACNANTGGCASYGNTECLCVAMYRQGYYDDSEQWCLTGNHNELKLCKKSLPSEPAECKP